MPGHIFVTRIIPAAGLDRVRAFCAESGLALAVWEDRLPPPYPILCEQARGAVGVLTTLNDRIDAAFMDAAGESLRVISQMAVGVDNIDVGAAAARGILVGSTPGVLTEATADLAFALLLASARRLYEGTRYIEGGEWITWDPTALLGGDLSGATLGIIGYGRIGRAVARRAHGFDMRILAYSRTLSPEAASRDGVEAGDLGRLLSESDYVSLHCPLTSETRRLINADTLALMKPTARLINTARGGVVDTEALVEALTSGVIAAAALDVTDPEPLPADHPLMRLENCIVVPHIGSATIGTRDRMANIAAANLIAGVRGEPLLHAVQAAGGPAKP
ncbi:MAG: D-glycerate dehydrogenase [Anaerolineae bacterium]|nr:D-glycerate dehydrogenase [Anaerolineae bacterium]NUQ03401.1 D-glycerate dehydrogenase [Anaerolineae bacterium]